VSTPCTTPATNKLFSFNGTHLGCGTHISMAEAVDL